MSKKRLYFRVILTNQILYAGAEPYISLEEVGKKYIEIACLLLEQGHSLEELNQTLRLDMTEMNE